MDTSNNIQIIYRANGQPTTPRLAQGVIANTIIGLTNQDLLHVCGFKFDLNVNVDLGLGELTAVKQLATALERGIKAGKKGVADVVRDEMKKAINELRTAVNTIVELIGISDFSGTVSISFSVAKNLLREDLEGVLATLSPRERDVLRLRYGLDDGRMKTLEEIGQIFDVTRERIRQIEAKALRKLRHPNRNSVLKEYIK